jgi:hypothetical protein
MHQPEHSARLNAQVTRGDTPMARATGGRAKAADPTPTS